MLLASYVVGRDNNLNLLRFVAASAVIVSHSFPLALGRQATDALQEIVGISLGDVAVDVFFVTSGFLVTGSLLYRRRISEFVLARCLRICPALIVLLLLSVLLGLGLTKLAWRDYLASGQTWSYLWRNATMIAGGAGRLPGVFGENPYDSIFNGSLWTLTWELRMYALLAVFWVVCGVTVARTLAFSRMVVAVAGVASVLWGLPTLVGDGDWASDTFRHAARFVALFFVGSAFYIARHRVPMSCYLLALAAFVAVCGVVYSVWAIYAIALAYVVLYVAYVPGGRIRGFNAVGDYSYGMYIYGFPVQQCIAASVRGVTPVLMMSLAIPCTWVLALCSWHFLEKRAMASRGTWLARLDELRGKMVARVRRR